MRTESFVYLIGSISDRFVRFITPSNVGSHIEIIGERVDLYSRYIRVLS